MSKPSNKANQTSFHGRRQLNDWLHYPLKKMQQKRGFAEGKLLTQWPEIVGTALAAHCVPQKLTQPKNEHAATLHVLCESGWAMQLQFQETLVLEKIATFFGYRAVGRIRIHQGVLNPQPTRSAAPAYQPTPEPTSTAPEVANVQDQELQDALNRLAQSRAIARKLENKP